MEPGSKSKDPEEPSGAGSTLSRSPESQSVTSAWAPRLGVGMGRAGDGLSHQSPGAGEQGLGEAPGRLGWGSRPVFLGAAPHSAPAQGRCAASSKDESRVLPWRGTLDFCEGAWVA